MARDRTTTRHAWFAERGGFVATPVHQLDDCPAGEAIVGPALLEAPESTVLVPPGWTAVVASTGAVTLQADVHSGALTAERDEADR